MGVGLVATIAALSGLVDEELRSTVVSVTLVVPVVIAAMVGGRRAAYIVAAAAALAFGLVVPPFGSFHVELLKDVVAMVVVALVALLVSTVVARRAELLDEIERQRAAVLRSVSHDFRTPLAIIHAASTELLDSDVHSKEMRDRMLTLIGDETNRLDRLVSNLLDLSRMEAGLLKPQRTPLDVETVVAESSGRFRRVFDQTSLEVEVDTGLPPLNADRIMMDQLLTNLLENAARHARDRSVVTLSARHHGESLAISVSDDGPGVAPERHAVIFDTFQAVGVTAGSGVGLSICKAIVDAHHGTIAVSDSPSGGATFTAVLPYA